MLRLGEDKLRDHIKTIGLYRNKAKNVIGLSRQLIDDSRRQRAAPIATSLEALPGVGRKTANVVLNIAFGQPTMAVDTHVFRVANRIGLSNGKTPLAVEVDLLRVVPPKYATARASLADPARALCLQGAPAGMPVAASFVTSASTMPKPPASGFSDANGNNYHNVPTGPPPLMAVSRVA